MHAPLDRPPSTCPDGLHEIGGYTICLDGLTSYYWFSHRVPDNQIEIAKSFLTQCRRTRWAREMISPLSHDLKHWIERWARQYISNGAVLIAALQLGITFVPYGERSALIGVNFDDVCARMAERCWHLTRHAFGTIRPKPPPPDIDPDQFERVARERGVWDLIVEGLANCDNLPDE